MKPNRLLALGVLLAGAAAIAPLTKAQKSTPPPPTEQQKLKDRVDALESQLKEAQTKADRAAMEKDYIDRIQKQYESYYEKVLATQTTSLTMLGLTLTALFTLGGLFSLKVFDDRTKNAIATAVALLEAKLNEKTEAEADKLRGENSAQMKRLEESLQERIGGLEKDLRDRSTWQFKFVQGLAGAADGRYDNAKKSFREALEAYKSGKPRQLVEKRAGVQTVRNVFGTLRRKLGDEFPEEANKELDDPIYEDLQEELALAALDLKPLATILQERKNVRPATQPATPTTAAQKPKEPPSDN